MKLLLTSTLLAAALAVAAPANAHGDPGRHGHGYAHGHYKHHRHAYGHDRHRHHPPHRVARREVNNYYYGYGAPAASSIPPGVHVVFPDVYLPFP